MSESSQECLTKCLICQKPATSYANPWKWHKLCSTHTSHPPSSHPCSICTAQVKILSPRLLSCEICNSEIEIKILSCNHCLCVTCLKKPDTCRICLSICSICQNEGKHLYGPCGHLYCDICFASLKEECAACHPTHCMLCNCRESLPFELLCEVCKQPCSNCHKQNLRKTRKDCDHLVCDKCSEDYRNYCSICQISLCKGCSLPAACSKSRHFACMECLSVAKNYQCILCVPGQKCQGCGLSLSTRMCHKGKHNTCVICNKETSFFCKYCDYFCCVCEEVIPFSSVIQHTCGHEICGECAGKISPVRCKMCPQIKDYYKCFSCKQEFWNKEMMVKKVKCPSCNKRICTACGGEVSLIFSHECKIDF